MHGVYAWLVLAMLIPAASGAAGQTDAQGDRRSREASSSRDATPRDPVNETRLQFGVAYEQLSNHYAPWRSASLELFSGNRRNAVYAALEETTRFSQIDHSVRAGIRHLVAARLTIAAEAGMSPSHHVSAKWGALGRMELDAGGGWSVQASLHHRRYSSASVDLGAVSVERYVSRYRGVYTLHLARLRGGDRSIGHGVQGDLYYGGSSNSIGINLSAGEELENILPVGVLRTHVRAAAVVGRQRLNPAWFIVYDAVVHEQGALYTRQRLGVVLGYRF